MRQNAATVSRRCQPSYCMQEVLSNSCSTLNYYIKLTRLDKAYGNGHGRMFNALNGPNPKKVDHWLMLEKQVARHEPVWI